MNRAKFTQGMRSDLKLSDLERTDILQKSLRKHHWKLKCTIAMEEFAELQQEISKQIRGFGDKTGLLEEMADAYICLRYLQSIFSINSEDLQKAIDVKLQREKEYLK